jgi:hypothetical protein
MSCFNAAFTMQVSFTYRGMLRRLQVDPSIKDAFDARAS